MRPVLLAALGAALLASAGAALADLYRWVDPETGSVKFSSYPPPWYGKPALERRSPKVERIPAGKAPPPAEPESPGEPLPAASQRPAPDAADPKAGSTVAGLETARKTLLQRLEALQRGEERGADSRALPPLLAAYQALVAELDRVDPQGAAARRTETQALLERLRALMGAPSGPKLPPPEPPRER
jgi:hypothetical protein